MANFIVIYRAPTSAMEAMQHLTTEEIQKGMEPWTQWAESAGDSLVELGSPLGNAVKITGEGDTPGDPTISGYSILQADNIDGALALLRGHPHLGWAAGCVIEVFESMSM